jgi:hypothetical protein
MPNPAVSKSLTRSGAWKGHDSDALDRLYREGMIRDAVGKAKSVLLTDDGLAGPRTPRSAAGSCAGGPGTWGGAARASVPLREGPT